ncbi:AAA family ATPase, partial [Nocardioides sp.]|uniref:ATP-binding protein n=1 Tax=Nocardioides sp. TaxID=35761 RepID=UPI002735E635
MTSPTTPDRQLVGRDAELAYLSDQLGIGAPGLGRHHAVVLAGDAGVGKTRLLTELRDLAFTEGWQVVAGHCLDFGDSALPYLPFTEIVGRLGTDLPDVVDRVSAEQPGLSRLRPGRRMIAEQGPGEGAADTSVARADLFDAVHALLAEAGAVGPLLVVVEDAHWADQSTRDLLSFLFARPVPGPVAIVASYRSDDLHRRHPLRRTAAEWSRTPGVGRLQLGPLEPGDVRALVRQLHPAPLPEPAVTTIVDRSEGNAFFVEELVGAASMGGSALPEDLAELLLVRLDRLDPGGQQVVRAASAAGRRVSHGLLAGVLELDETTLEEALRSAVESNVLVAASGDGYAFRHALLAEAVYDDLLPGERVRFHAAFTRILRERTATGTAAELARHARAAHDLATALSASIEAGDDAMAVGGPDEAADHYEAALELLGERSSGDLAHVDRGNVVSRAANALITSGRPHRALTLVTEQLDSLPDDAPDAWRIDLLIAQAATIMVVETTLDPLRSTARALELLPPEPSKLRARALGVHARALAARRTDEAREEAREVAAEALSLAEKLDLPKLAADVMTTLLGLQGERFDADAVAALEDVVRRAAASGAISSELRGLYLLARRHQDRGEFAEARRAFQRGMARAEQSGSQWAPYGFDARFMDAQIAYLTGEWDDVLGRVDVTGRRAPAVASALAASLRLLVHAGRGQLDEATRLAAEVRPLWPRDGLIVITAGAGMIDATGDSGDARGALGVHDDVVAEISRVWGAHAQVRVRLAALVVGQLARGVDHRPAAERVELMEAVQRVHEGAQRTLEVVREQHTDWGPEGRAWVARLAAEMLRFRWLSGIDAPPVDQLVAAWEASVAAFESFGHRFEAARSQARLAAVHRAAGDLDA